MIDFDYMDEDITLIDSIKKISSQISFSGSDLDIAHSQFLLEIVEDMEEQVHSNRNRRLRQKQQGYSIQVIN